MIEAGILLLILVLIFGAFLILRSIKDFVINAIMGLIILFVANALLDPNIGYNWLVVLICGIGGVPGALLVILLRIFGIVV